MSQNAVEREIRIEAPIDVVWETVTNPDQMSRWMCDKAEVDLRPGGNAAITWNDHGITEMLKVETVEAPTLFSFRWLNPKDQAPNTKNSTLVEFILSADGDATILRFVESGFEELDWNEETKASAIEGHTEGWKIHGDALVRYFASNRQVPARS